MSSSPMINENPAVPGTLRFLADALGRRVESSLPVSSAHREKVQASGIIRKVVNVLCITLLAALAFVGLTAIVTVFYGDKKFIRTIPIIGEQMHSLNANLAISRLRKAPESSLAKWQSPSGATRDALHGPLPSRDVRNSALFDLFESKLVTPLNRVPTDNRSAICQAKDYPAKLISTSVVVIFCNEPFETLMRSVHSVLNNSPPSHLLEIVLVDDGSDAQHIRPRTAGGNGLLEDYVALLNAKMAASGVVPQTQPSGEKVRLLRTGKRSGIVQARLTGIKAARGEAFVILDSHIEAQPGWLEALIYPIASDKRNVVMPRIDGIDKTTHALQKGGVGCTLGLIWKVMEHSFSPTQFSPPDRLSAREDEYVTSPTMAGGLFAAHRDFFLTDLGGYDEGMTGWGAENVEFSFRLWQCGGKLLCTGCSRVYHMFGGGKYYTTSGRSTTANRMRTMATWMDEYADVAWRVLGEPSFDEIGDISGPLKFREEKQCQPFQWFIDNVWPESELRKLPEDLPHNGPLISASEGLCVSRVHTGSVKPSLVLCSLNAQAKSASAGSFMYWRRDQRITATKNDELCLDHQDRWEFCRGHGNNFELIDLSTQSKEKDGTPSETILKELKVVAETLQAKLHGKGSPNYDLLDAYVKGDISAVRIRDADDDKCLTVISSDGKSRRMELADCTDDLRDLDQIWFWPKYSIDKFWNNLHSN